MKLVCALMAMIVVAFAGPPAAQSLGAQKKKAKPRQMAREPRSARQLAPSDSGQPVIFADAHVHLNDTAMQLELMEEYGTPWAVVFWGRDSNNDSILEAAGAHPGRLIPFVSVSPERRMYRKLWEHDDPKLLMVLEHRLKSGVFKGIGEISVTHFPGNGFPEADYSPTGPTMKGIMTLARKYKAPVTIHCEVTRIREFSALLDEFTDVPVLWAHGGYTPYFLAKRMLEKHANLYYELSARTWINHPRSPEYTIFESATKVWPRWLNLIESYPERFLVGTDAAHHDRQREKRKIESVHLLLRQLSPKTRDLVALENLRRLVG